MASDGILNFDRRSSGLLLHPTSLPSRHGSGDVGKEAHHFVDFLAAAGQRWWQMLPIGPLGRPPGYSPYSSYSAMAGSPWLINLDRLVEDGLLDRDDVEPAGGLDGKKVNFTASIRFREPRLRKAFDRFGARGAGEDGFGEFCRDNHDWLDDYALFAALKQAYGGKEWFDWDRDVRLREPAALREAARTHAREIEFHQFVQYRFDRQWRELRSHCHSRDVGLIGDIPIFVALESADVWAHRHLFLLDKHGRPKVVTGAPPDAFAAGGQVWNHPHYCWNAHRKDHYAWWVQRFAQSMKHFDGVRIDHFLGFHRAWAVKAGATDAREGKWLPAPGEEVFNAVRRKLGRFPVIAEDLGYLTPKAIALRERFEFPGMRILQIGLDGVSFHLPHCYVPHCVAYTGTHDNQTAVGWFKSLAHDSDRRRRALEYLGAMPATIHLDMIRALMTSVANTVIFPVQDLLGLGAQSRMNTPGVAEGNWNWRLRGGELTAAVAHHLRQLTEYTNRV